jgi:hypothetical protein
MVLTRHVSGVKTLGSMRCAKAVVRMDLAADAASRLSKRTLMTVDDSASHTPIQAPEKQINKGAKRSLRTMSLRAIGPRAVANTTVTADRDNSPNASLTSALKA